MLDGGLIFITGFSGSGKSTLANMLVKSIYKIHGIRAVLLDGDSLRECVGNVDYSHSGREQMSMYYVRTASMLAKQGFLVVLATISMFRSVRQFNRDNFANYLEVYLNVDNAILQERDSKGYYKDRATNMAITQNLELPTHSDFVFYDNFDKDEAIRDILSHLKLR